MRQNTAWRRLAWVRITPLGTPVLPEVYMIMAVSWGPGGEHEMCEVDPEDRIDENRWKETVAVSGGRGAGLWLGITITFLTAGACGRTARSFGRRSSPTMMVEVSVWVTPCKTPSSPRFV